MRQNILAAALGFAASVAAKGSPILAQRATSTLTPVTITGNGMFLKIFLGNNHLTSSSFL